MVHIRGILVAVVSLLTFSSVALLLWRSHVRRIVQIPAYLDYYWDTLKDRRKSIRFKERLPVTCSVAERTGNIHHIFSRDISGEGVCLQVPEVLPEGTQLDLKISIPNDGHLAVVGEVVWVKEDRKESEQSERSFSTGVKFTKIDSKDTIRLGNFLHSISQGDKADESH